MMEFVNAEQTDEREPEQAGWLAPLGNVDSRSRYAINGRIYYETPTGELSVTDPYPNGNKVTEPSDAAERE